jgi:hypothetical protein
VVDELPPAPAAGAVLRVAPATVIIFAVLFSPALGACGVLLWKGQQAIDAAFLVVLYALAVAFMCDRTVELAPGALVYRVLFVRKRVSLSAVCEVRVTPRPAPWLELRREGERQPVPAFILKPFTQAGVTAILRHVVAAAPTAELDPIAADLCQGRFDSLTRETLRARNLMRIVLTVAGAAIAAALARALAR